MGKSEPAVTLWFDTLSYEGAVLAIDVSLLLMKLNDLSVGFKNIEFS